MKNLGSYNFKYNKEIGITNCLAWLHEVQTLVIVRSSQVDVPAGKENRQIVYPFFYVAHVLKLCTYNYGII